MMTEAKIMMDFTKTKFQADAIERVAKELNNLAQNELLGTMQSLRNDWKGENSDNYTKKGDLVAGNISKTAKELDAIAKDIRAVAKAMYDAEMEALRIARERIASINS